MLLYNGNVSGLFFSLIPKSCLPYNSRFLVIDNGYLMQSLPKCPIFQWDTWNVRFDARVSFESLLSYSGKKHP